jgi:hypothetical protein
LGFLAGLFTRMMPEATRAKPAQSIRGVGSRKKMALRITPRRGTRKVKLAKRLTW